MEPLIQQEQFIVALQQLFKRNAIHEFFKVNSPFFSNHFKGSSGHVNLIQAIFPEGTRGPALDVMSRAPLWEAGLDFKHGTGHGIGCWLNVHEPPVGLYLSPRADCVAQSQNHFYTPGYCVTDEPGFYKDGEFGMRIENAIYVVEADTNYNLPGGQKFYKVSTFWVKFYLTVDLSLNHYVSFQCVLN